jgi:hypothetical protein
MVMSRRPVSIPTAPLSIPSQHTPIHLDDVRSKVGLKRLGSDRDPTTVHVPVPNREGDKELQARRGFLEETPPKKIHALPSWEGRPFMNVSGPLILFYLTAYQSRFLYSAVILTCEVPFNMS